MPASMLRFRPRTERDVEEPRDLRQGLAGRRIDLVVPLECNDKASDLTSPANRDDHE
jgi:hypothetical protein